MVVAAPVWLEAIPASHGVYLLNAASGAILDFISTGSSAVFSQPVFAGNDLLIAGNFVVGLTAYEITTPGRRSPSHRARLGREVP